MNDRGLVSARELDIGNAVMMKALSLASEKAATCLDWNNNYGQEDDKCILFHCRPVPQGTMADQGRITEDPIPEDFFGCAGVAEIQGLQDALRAIGYAGFRHHVSVTAGHVLESVREALEKYLGYEVLRV